MASERSGLTRGRSVCQRPWKYIAISPRFSGDEGPAAAPNGVPHAVHGFEIEQRRATGRAADDVVDARLRAIGEKHRTGLRAERDHVARPVVLFVAARPLVLLDDVAIVLVERKAG